jgi:HemY protein
MRAAIWLVLLFVAAVLVASTLGRNDGLASFYWNGWRMDMSLNLFVIALLALCVLLLAVYNAVSTLVGLPARARGWRALRRERAAQAALREALAEFLGARYTRAQKAAQRALSIQANAPEGPIDRDLQVLCHLLAAASAHRLQDRSGRDEQLRLALKLPPLGILRGADDGARLMAAEWALDDRDTTRALALLGELPPGVARRTQALRLKLQAQRLARLPLEALRTARLLAKHQGFSPVAAQGLLRSLAFEAVDTAHDIEQLQRIWQQLDISDRRDAYVTARVAQRAVALEAPDAARGWLRPQWERMSELAADEREQLALALLGAVRGIDAEWLPRLEAAHIAHAQEPAVVAAVGAAYAEQQLWGKAGRLLEEAAASPVLASRTRRKAWRTLAQLARNQGDEPRAAASEQAAAQID